MRDAKQFDLKKTATELIALHAKAERAERKHTDSRPQKADSR